MIILDATTKSLQIKLSGAVTANQLPFAASYIDSTGTSTTPGEQDGTSNNTTAATVVSAPASSTQRLIKNSVIQNADTAPATVTIIYNNNATLRNVVVATLAIGDQLIYEDGQGWSCLDSNGNIKTSAGGATMAANSLRGNNTNASGAAADLTIAQVGSLIQGYGGTGFVNKFRNAAMDIWQRATGSQTVTTAGAYVSDGWIVVPTGASCTAQQASNTRTGASSLYGLKMTGATSVTDIVMKQRIESYIAQPLAGQQVTVQAEVLNNTGSSITPTLTVKHATAQDNWGATSTDVNAVNLQACPNGSWTLVSYTFAANASSGNGLEVSIDFGNNFSTNGKSVTVSELDIRVTPNVATGLNSAPPAPELRPISSELAFCQRYFWKSFLQGTAVAQNAGTSTGELGFFAIYSGANSNRAPMVMLPVTMRAVPTITLYNPSAANAQVRNQTAGADCTSSSTNRIGDQNFTLSWTGTAGTSAGDVCVVHATASAEL